MGKPLLKPLHLLRAILRECTYLPDRNARSYIHKYALLRFKKYQDAKDLTHDRCAHLLQKGRKGLSVLRRANEGYIDPLQKVLWTTYGRIGRRRRQLMAEIMMPQVKQDSSAVSTLELAPKYRNDWEPSSLFQALLESQSKESERLENAMRGKPAKNIKLKPQIPEKNIWGLATPLKRVKNLTRKWYAKSANSLLPPIPDHEWERLRQLASGEIPCSDIKPRRKALQQLTTASDQLLQGDTLVDGSQKDGFGNGDVRDQPHQITARFMRRRYELVLRHTPLASWDEVRKKWFVKWAAAPRPSTFQRASESQKDLFFGDDIDGEMT
ncbi:MAG: hypothetical protein Q9160_007740 [Pyrenula sp. 1 TL-2023]